MRDILEAGGFVVDNLVRTKALEKIAMATRRDRYHFRALRARELHGETADAAGGAMDQHALAGGEPAVIE